MQGATMPTGPNPLHRGRGGLSALARAFGLAVTGCGAAPQSGPQSAPEHDGSIAIVIHGGAGTITRASMTPEMEAEYRAKLEEALRAGYAVLESGGTSLDAVVAAIGVMEDSPLFNAGKGAVFTSEGTNELDASIMDGATLEAGAVAGVKRVKNPITLARAVMERSPHVMMIGIGAETFAAEQGIELVEPEYFFTQRRWDALQRIKAQEAKAASDVHGSLPVVGPDAGLALAPAEEPFPDDRKFGTVGAVALDRHGNLAAGTSTGGMTNKRFGRVGDAPIIGAGTYASQNCAVSATGHGEFFMRNVVAYDICARMAYTGVSLERAAHQVVMERLVQQGGDGGIIAMDASGNYTLTFNSEGMYRGYVGPDGRTTVAIYRDEELPAP